MNGVSSLITKSDYIIEEWPRQEKITLFLQVTLEQLFQEVKPLVSEFSFPVFLIFSKSYNYRICEIDNMIMITGKDSQGNFAVFPFGAPTTNIIQMLIEHNIYIKMIPHMYKNSLLENVPQNTLYKIFIDEGDSDYIYKRSNLALLPGRKFHKKRNLVNLFLKTYPKHRTAKITSQNQDDVFQILNIWEAQHFIEDDDYEAIKTALINYKKIPLFGQITYVNDIPAGFIIGELRRKNTCAVIHFEKADTQFCGIYQFINQNFAKTLPKECRIINREQDLGKEGLRQAKHTYRPNAYLKKYRLVFSS